MKKLLICTIFIFLTSLVHASNYYVDCANGSNGSPGTFDQPWRTPLQLSIFGAASPGFQPGDGIYFKRGCVFYDGIHLSYITVGQTNSGTSGSPILLDSYGGLNSPPGTGAAPEFTGKLPIAAVYWSVYSGNIWVSKPLYDASGSGSDNCVSDHNCVQCPAAGFTYSCYDQALKVLNYVRFGTIWGNNQEVAVGSSSIGAALTTDRDWYFNPATSGSNLQSLFVYCTCTGGVTPDVYFGGVAPIAISGESWPANSAPTMLGLQGVQWLQIQHLNFDWYDGLGIFIQSNSTSNPSDHIWIANVAANSYVENGVYRQNTTGALCIATTSPPCASNNGGGSTNVEQYTQIGFWINNYTASGVMTGFTDVHLWNDDFHANYTGIQAGTAVDYACYQVTPSVSPCVLDIVNTRVYGSRNFGIADYLGGAAKLSFSHLYANNLATALETDVETLWALPGAGITCAGGTVTATWLAAQAPILPLTAGEPFTVQTGSPTGGGLPLAWAGNFTVNTWNPATHTLTWTMSSCPSSSATGGNILLTAVNETAQSSFQAVLNWLGSGTFNVYRSTTPGGESLASPLVTGLTSPTYTDTTVSGGSTYYYVVTSSTDPGVFSQETKVEVDLGKNLWYVSVLHPNFYTGAIDYANVQMPGVQNWKRWTPWVMLNYDDPGLVLYSDNYVAQVLGMATAKLGTANFSIATVTGAEYSGLNINQSNANPGFVTEVQSWITAGYDVLTHSTSHSYWAPPASACGVAAVFKVPCHIIDSLVYTGSVASTVSLTISHNGTTCSGLGVSSSACLVITTSPNDSTANRALDLTQYWPYTTGAGSSMATLSQVVASLNAGPFAASQSGTGCGFVCFDFFAGDAPYALSHSLDDTYSAPGTPGSVSLTGAGYNLDFLAANDTANTEPPYFETDEMSWSNTWMNHYLTSLPSNRIYVMPGTYGDSASETVAAGLGYAGVRGTGSLKPCCAANTTLANGYDRFNILSQGVNPNLQNMSYFQMRALLQADVFKNGLWGRPAAFFWHIYELPYDQVENMMDAALDASATVVGDTTFLNGTLLNAPSAGAAPVAGQCVVNDLAPPIGVGDKGVSYPANSFYACSSTGNEANWLPTPNSPTNGTGNNLGAPWQYDLNGNLRTQWDMGALRFN
jgi:hypothetical protein